MLVPTAAELSRIPRRNVRVPLSHFGVVWVACAQDESIAGSWARAGVTITCRWMAQALGPPLQGRRMLAAAALTSTRQLAYEELIQAEWMRAEHWAITGGPAAWVTERPGFVLAVRDMLRWCWADAGEPPFGLDPEALLNHLSKPPRSDTSKAH